MSTSVKLTKNRTYPTYQLYALSASDKLAPFDCLKLCVKITLSWLANRLGDAAPSDIKKLAPVFAADEPCTEVPSDEILFSKHINEGYVVDIVYLKEKLTWSLQITEPDLGSNPGAESQAREAVAGRMIQTDLEYKVSGDELEMGFKTTISDPENAPLAECYRFALIKRFVNNPCIGLKQVIDLTEKPADINTKHGLDDLIDLWKNYNNQLPIVVFTDKFEPEEKSNPQDAKLKIESYYNYRKLNDLTSDLMQTTQTASQVIVAGMIQNKVVDIEELKRKAEEPKSIYDINTFARSCMGYGRTYTLQKNMFDAFAKSLNKEIMHGSIIILEPWQFGAAVTEHKYKTADEAKISQLKHIKEYIMSYSREKTINYGTVSFLSVVRNKLVETIEELKKQTLAISSSAGKTANELTEKYAEIISGYEKKIEELGAQINNLKMYQKTLKDDKQDLLKKCDEIQSEYQKKLSSNDEYIEYLKRCLDRPSDPAGIVEWANRHFNGRLYFHQKAIDLLNDKSLKVTDMGKLSDAIDFLATEYYDSRYSGLSDDEIGIKCTQKYGRPFDVIHQSDMTIDAYPREYKIKYFKNAMGKTSESPLDYHLRAGNDAEYLIRIYFLHDDENKLIVIGSLPNHLPTLKV